MGGGCAPSCAKREAEKHFDHEFRSQIGEEFTNKIEYMYMAVDFKMIIIILILGHSKGRGSKNHCYILMIVSYY